MNITYYKSESDTRPKPIEYGKKTVYLHKNIEEKTRTDETTGETETYYEYDEAKMSYSETYGARNLRRCIENEVEDRIVDLIMEQQGSLTRISVGCRNGKLTVQAK